MTQSTTQSPALPLMPLKMLEEHPSLSKRSCSLHCSVQGRRACRHPEDAKISQRSWSWKATGRLVWETDESFTTLASIYFIFFKLCVTYITHVSTSLWFAVFWLKFSRLSWKGKRLLKSKTSTPNQPGTRAQACKARHALWMVKEHPSWNKSC